METRGVKSAGGGGWRTALILIGLVLAAVGNFTGFWLLAIAAIVLVLIGCYQWTKLKNRHWAFMFWGLLAPIGLLGIALLRDKSWEEIPQMQRTEAQDPSGPAGHARV